MRLPLGWFRPLGAATTVAGLLCTLVGVRTGWVELAVPGVALLLAVLASSVLLVGRSTYRMEIDLAAERVVVGQEAFGRLLVTNTSERRLLPARVELPVGQGHGDFALPSLAGGEQHEELFAVPTRRRAVVPVGPVRSVRGDALGLLSRALTWTDAVLLHVHPRTANLRGIATGVLRDLEGQATQVLSDNDMSFHALRDYVPGDDKRHIHWRASAKQGDLLVRQFEDTRRTRTAIALATASDCYVSSDAAELAVSVLASVAVQTILDDRDLTALAGDPAPKGAAEQSARPGAGLLRVDTPQVLLDDTCAIDIHPGGRSDLALAPWVARQAPDATVVLLVTGSVTDPVALRSTVRRLPVGTRTVVIRCEPGAELSVAQTGSTTTAVLGVLGELGRLLRQAVRA